MNYFNYALAAAMLLLTACSSSHRPVYSGHQESTEGVPGFVNGQKVSPYVKLGQSYSVDGEDYVPRYQPDYVEEGLASWYGPGFHGGKTANGESFDKHDMTAAHRTLPLPSIVRVTMIETGKSTYVRINDRGPFAKGRIIDLSRAAAEEIGLIGKGVGRVRVEYMPQESQRFADLLAEGREPQSIDLADEVIGKGSTNYAKNTVNPAPVHKSLVSHLNPVSSAVAAEPTHPVSQETLDSAEFDQVASNDLAAPASPFAVLKEKPPVETTSSAAAMVIANNIAHAATPPAPPVEPGLLTTMQLGAFLQKSNAEKLTKKVSALGTTSIEEKPGPDGNTLYVVRMVTHTGVDESSRVLAQLNGLGINPRILKQ